MLNTIAPVQTLGVRLAAIVPNIAIVNYFTWDNVEVGKGKKWTGKFSPPGLIIQPSARKKNLFGVEEKGRHPGNQTDRSRAQSGLC